MPKARDDRSGDSDPAKLDAREPQDDSNADRQQHGGAEVGLEHDEHGRNANVDRRPGP